MRGAQQHGPPAGAPPGHASRIEWEAKDTGEEAEECILAQKQRIGRRIARQVATKEQAAHAYDEAAREHRADLPLNFASIEAGAQAAAAAEAAAEAAEVAEAEATLLQMAAAAR